MTVVAFEIGFESTSFSAGRIVRNSSGYAVQYHITDHLGSVRAVLNQSMSILEQNDYYPFGLRHPNSALKTTANRYRYNGKEKIAADAVVDSLLQISTIDKENVDKIKVLDSPSTYVRAL